MNKTRDFGARAVLILRRFINSENLSVHTQNFTTAIPLIRSTVIELPMRRKNSITSVMPAVEKKFNRTEAVGFVGILQILHKFWGNPEIAVRF